MYIYLVKFHCYKAKNDLDWTHTWHEAFTNLKAAIRFGMRMYREFEDIKDFRTEKMIIRAKYTEKLW